MKIEDYISKNEAIRLRPYTDTVGKLTIGVGRNLDDNGLSLDEVEYLLKNDIKRVKGELEDVFDNFYELPENVRLVMIDMCFNLGISRFLGFKKMIQAVKDGDFKEAGRQAKDSKWCRQVGVRCDKNYKLLIEASL